MAISIETDEKGKIHFPKKFGIHPREKLFVDKMDDTIIIRKAKEQIVNAKETGNEIVGILKENLKDAKWEDIEKDREDNEREW